MFPCYIEEVVVEEVVGIPEEGYAPILFPNETPVTFLMTLTGVQFTRILSALTNGAYLTYGEEGRQVIWDFLKWVDYPMPICEQIIACITTDEDTKNALRDFILGDTAINDRIESIAEDKVLSAENRERNLLKPDECDPDFIFNQASITVQLLHDVTEDIFEAIEVASNQIERADIVISAFPAGGFNDTAATVFRLADQLLEELSEQYSGHYDEALYDVIRCKLFCASRDDCELSLTKVIEVYRDLLDEAIPSDPVTALIYIMDYLATGDVPNDVIVYAMHLLVLLGIQAGSDVFGIDFLKLANRILAAGDEGDNDWEILCEDCNEPPPPDPACQSFLSDHTNWETISYGTWSSGEGFEGEFAVGKYRLYIHRVAWLGTAYKVVVKFNVAITDMYLANDNGTSLVVYSGPATTDMEFSADTIEGWTDRALNQGMSIGILSGQDVPFSLYEVCIYLVE